MNVPDDMIAKAAETLRKEYPSSLNDEDAQAIAKDALEAALGDLSPTSLFFLGPFIQDSHLILIIPKGGGGGAMYRPIPGDSENVERVGDWHLDLSFAKDDHRITAFRVTHIPPRQIQE